MTEFLSSDLWQGIGVISSIILAIVGIIFTTNLKRMTFKTKNSFFNSEHSTPKELLDGQIISLCGKVREEVFPGPPNYESINNGDKPQFYWILYVNEPVTMIGRCPESDQVYDAGNTCCFQLRLNNTFYNNRSDILDKYVKVDGQIFLGHSGHHKTIALVDVTKLKVIR